MDPATKCLGLSANKECSWGTDEWQTQKEVNEALSTSVANNTAYPIQLVEMPTAVPWDGFFVCSVLPVKECCDELVMPDTDMDRRDISKELP